MVRPRYEYTYDAQGNHVGIRDNVYQVGTQIYYDPRYLTPRPNSSAPSPPLRPPTTSTAASTSKRQSTTSTSASAGTTWQRGGQGYDPFAASSAWSKKASCSRTASMSSNSASFRSAMSERNAWR